MSEDKGSLEHLRLEYSEANNNLRHYSNLRFAVLTVFFAVLGGVVAVGFGIVEIKSPTSENIVLWARIAGLIFTIVFFSLEVVCHLNLRHFQNVARELEDLLGYHQFKTRKFRFPKPFYFTWGMYGALIIFWLFCILRRV
jgi:hypothetical protein